MEEIKENKNCCLNCIFFKPETTEFFGSCRRYPVEFEKRYSDWCGEFKKKENVLNEG